MKKLAACFAKILKAQHERNGAGISYNTLRLFLWNLFCQ